MVSKSINPTIERLSPVAHWFFAAAGLLVMYLPTLLDLLRGEWGSSEQAHGPIVFVISLWLLYKKWDVLLSVDDKPSVVAGSALFVVALAVYILGRSQDFILLELGSLVLMLASLILLMVGPRGLKEVWFALFFMCFMVPLPGTIVDAITLPMKMAVSYVVETALFQLGYPIARAGVMLQIGQYQLLVADACAGLHTLFTLEALGLLYLNLVRHHSVVRNIILAILIVPISFSANAIRVAALTLITYYFGDEAGQGFMHGFAGLVLFLSALLLIIFADTILRRSVEKSARV